MKFCSMKKKKLKLEELRVKSFTTEFEGDKAQTIQGGGSITDIITDYSTVLVTVGAECEKPDWLKKLEGSDASNCRCEA